MNFEALLEHIKGCLGEEAILSIDESCTPMAIVMGPEKLLEHMEVLHAEEQLYFDQLSCVTGIDNGPEAGTMEVIYQLYSIAYNHHLMVKVQLNREQPILPSLVSVWKTADWHEREAYDLLGIRFENHPDLRRILLPADWEGHPLRKDYQHQEYYRGVKVAY